MFWTIASLVLLVALGGFISYYGDLQGRRWGKRRVSLFGMRPKHTAILLTTITGAFISFFSIITLLLVSAPLREVILHGEEAIRQNRNLRTQEQSEVRLLKLTNTQYDQTKNQLASTIQDLQKSQRAMVTTQASLSREKKDITAAGRALRVTQNRLVRAKALEVSLQTQQNVLISKQHVLSEGNRTLAQQGRGSSLQYKTTRLKLSEAQSALRRISQQTAIITDVTPGTGQALITGYLNLRKDRICIRAGAELDRSVINPSTSMAAADDELNRALSMASRMAARYGAQTGTGGLAVRLLPGATAPGETTSHSTLLSFARQIVNSSSPSLIIITAAVNTLTGEQCRVSMRMYTVRPVFRQGELVAKATLNGALSRRSLVQRIASFLQSKVRLSARGAGIIPKVDPITGDGEIGNFGPFSLVDLADKLHKIGGRAVISARAVSLITSADLLTKGNLALQVVPLGRG